MMNEEIKSEPVAWMLRRDLWAKYNGYRRFADSRSDGLWDVPVYTSAPTIPEGYVMVPVEPTDDMQEAGCDVDCPQDGAPTPYSVYKAMLAAAPKGETA